MESSNDQNDDIEIFTALLRAIGDLKRPEIRLLIRHANGGIETSIWRDTDGIFSLNLNECRIRSMQSFFIT